MPFKKVGPDDYVSPSGRHWTKAQVRLYHATGGFKKKPKRTHEALSAADILTEERERALREVWGVEARTASAYARRSAGAQARAKARGIASAAKTGGGGGGGGKAAKKPKRAKVRVAKAAYNKVNAFGGGVQRAMP